MAYKILHIGPAWESLDHVVIDIYYTSAFYTLSRHIQQGTPKCFLFEQEGNSAFYPFFQERIPDTEWYDIEGAYGYNGVISDSLDPAFRQSFHEAFRGFCREEGIIAEFTRFHPGLRNHAFSESYLDIRCDRQTVQINLEGDYASIWEQQYSGRNRNMIRKAEQIGLQCVFGSSMADYKRFSEMYAVTMKAAKAPAFYLFPESYFQGLYEMAADKRLLLWAVMGGQVVAGIVLLFHASRMHYHLSARIEGEAPSSATNFLLDQAVKLAQERNCLSFHLGGGRSPAADDLLLTFKSSFSQHRLNFYTGRHIHQPQAYQSLVSRWDQLHPEEAKARKDYLLRYRL